MLTRLAGITRVFAAFAALVAGGAIAQSYPEKPVRVVVPYVAGGATDIYARILSKNLAEVLGRPFIVDNRSGAATIVGAQAVAQAPKDGYTLLFTVSATFSANPHLYKKLPYSVEDFSPLAMVGRSSGWTISVHPSMPARNLKELVAFAKARPGEVVMGSLGRGSGPYLVGKSFERLAGLKLVEVSYKGSAEAMRDLIAGHIAVYCDGLSGALPQHQAGKLRIVAITGPKRSPLVPDVPTLAASGYPEMVLTNFWALLAPAGTPAEIIRRLQEAAIKAAEHESYRSRFIADAGIFETSGPSGLAEMIKRDTETWRRLISALNIPPE